MQELERDGGCGDATPESDCGFGADEVGGVGHQGEGAGLQLSELESACGFCDSGCYFDGVYVEESDMDAGEWLACFVTDGACDDWVKGYGVCCCNSGSRNLDKRADKE